MEVHIFKMSEILKNKGKYTQYMKIQYIANPNRNEAPSDRVPLEILIETKAQAIEYTINPVRNEGRSYRLHLTILLKWGPNV